MEVSVTPHLDDGLIHELVDGEIESSRLGAIQAHLSACDSCRSRLDQARNAAGFVDSLLEQLDPEHGVDDPQVVPLPARQPHWGRNLAWAASLVLAVGLGYIGRGEFLPSQPQSQANTETTRVAEPVTEPDAAPLQTTLEVEAPRTMPAPSVELRQRAPDPQPAATTAPAEERPIVAAAEAERRDQPSRAMEMAERGFEDAAASTRGARVAAPQALSAGAAAKTDQRSSVVVDLPAAMVTLGGSIRLIDGMVPERLEQLGDTVTVIYRAMDLPLRLRQYLIGTDLSWSLDAPARFPADSLAALRARVK